MIWLKTVTAFRHRNTTIVRPPSGWGFELLGFDVTESLSDGKEICAYTARLRLVRSHRVVRFQAHPPRELPLYPLPSAEAQAKRVKASMANTRAQSNRI